MKRILLDSGILSDYVNRRRGVPEKLRDHVQLGIRIGTCIPLLAEIAAIKYQHKAIEMATDEKDKVGGRGRLELYKNKHPKLFKVEWLDFYRN